MTDARAASLLLVEDDDLDVMGIERALAALNVVNPIVRASDGVEALDYLRGDNGRDKIEPPFIVLLDLNMPRMNGHEFIKEVRNDAELRSCIIFVLTTSAADDDRARAYAQNVAGYIVKADPTRSFREAIKLIDDYWTIVELP